MTQEELIEIIKEDAKGKARPVDSVWLRKPENVLRWRDELVLLKKDVEAQLTERKAKFDDAHNQCRDLEGGKRIYFNIKVEFDKWKAGAIRFKTSIEARLVEADRLIRENPKLKPQLQEGSKKSKMWKVIAWAARLIPDSGEGRDWHDAADDAGLEGYLQNERERDDADDEDRRD